MKLQRVLNQLSALTDRGQIPRGVLDEGRIFDLGAFDNSDHLHGRVREIVEGLKDHVGQPFDLHPWAFSYEITTFHQDGKRSPMRVVGLVWPQKDQSVLVRDYLATPRGLRFTKDTLFRHTTSGTTVTVRPTADPETDVEDLAAGSFYPPAIAILNTRGCHIEQKGAPSIANAKRKRQGKPLTPSHYKVDSSEYFTALSSTDGTVSTGGTHASPIPHLRRAHERTLPNGKRIWIPSALVNVRSEGDFAFVERRKAYKSPGQN